MYYLLFDIGGTKTRLAVSSDRKSFGEPKIVPTPKNFNEAIALFQKVASELRGSEKITAAAGGIAGPLDKEKAKLVNSPNLPDWVQKALKEELQKAIDAPVYLENDAAIVALGEAIYGAGRGEEIVAYITVSTGVGGARIVDGRIDKNAMGFEPGHQIIDPAGALCPICNKPGHLEGYVSGTALEKRYKTKPHEITDPKVWDEIAKWLAYGLNNVIVHWSPDIVVLGGSMIVRDPGIPIDRVRFYLKENLRIFPEPPPIEKATLSDLGGLYGALALLNQSIQT